MLCSICNKRPAVVFINKVENGKNSLEGLCYSCAKEKGINPLEIMSQNANISQEDLNQITEQFGNIINEFSENMDMNVEDINSENDGENNPLSSLFNIFKNNNNNENNKEKSANSNSGSSRRNSVRVEKKAKNNKKRFLDTFGTNLTTKAKDNLLDDVIGRENEIERVTQILNRRSKNNPCLIGEPGVGKTAIAQGLALKIARGEVPAKLLKKKYILLI